MVDPAAAADAAPLLRPSGDDEADAALSLARAGVATHAVAFDGPAAAGATLTDEARALEALAALVEGRIFRLAPLRYAVRLGGDSAAGEALAAALAQALGVAPVVARLDAPAAAAGDDAADLLRDFAAEPAPVRVLDAAAAVAAAARAAARIAAVAEAAEARLAETAAAAAAALSARLDRLERDAAAAPDPAALAEAVAARLSPPDPAPLAALAERLAAVEAAPALTPDARALAEAVAALLPAPDLAPLAARIDALADRLAAVEAAVAPPPDPAALAEAVAAQLPPPDPAPLAAVADRLAAVEAALARLAEAAPDVEGPLAALGEEVRALAARPAAPADLRAEREALNRAVFGLQTLMARLEAEAARLGDDRLAPLAGRLDALAAALAPLAETRDAARRAVEQGAALIETAGVLRAASDELRGLRAGRLAARLAGSGRVDEALVERLGATLAEFLAQLHRLEARRAAERAPAERNA